MKPRLQKDEKYSTESNVYEKEFTLGKQNEALKIKITTMKFNMHTYIKNNRGKNDIIDKVLSRN